MNTSFTFGLRPRSTAQRQIRDSHDVSAFLGADTSATQSSASKPCSEYGVSCSAPLAALLSVDQWHLWHLWQVTTKGVKHIARGCPNLAVLNLYHCSKVQVRAGTPAIAHTCFFWPPSLCVAAPKTMIGTAILFVPAADQIKKETWYFRGPNATCYRRF